MVVRGSPCVLALVAGFASTAIAQTMFVVNSGPCTIVDSGACIQSDNYPSNYATGAGAPTKHCDVDVNNNYDLFVTAFDVQAGSGGGSPCDQDYVRVSDGSTNMDYCNTDNPLSAGGVLSMTAFMCGVNTGSSACKLEFFSDGSTTAGGWKLCQYSPPKPPPPSSPSPPMSPPAPKPPGVLCENTCLDKDNKVNSNTAYMRNDGYCSDGGKSDSEYDAQALAKWGGNSGLESNYGCKLGTDCADCGARTACTTCAQTCIDRSNRLGHKHTCWDDMYKNGACDPECNNWECGHDGGDCNPEEAITQCTIGHNDKSLKSKPAQVTGSTVMGFNDTSKLADVELVVLSADPILLNLQEATNSWVMSLGFQFAMRWRDTRVKTMACTKFLEQALSIEATDPADDRLSKSTRNNLLWQPVMHLEGKSLTFVPDTSTKQFSISEQKFAHWAGSTNGLPFVKPTTDGATACVDCVGLNTTVALDVEQHPALKFGQFPFDIQVFRFSLSAPGANFFNCETLFADSGVNVSALAPLSGEWNAWKLESVPVFAGNVTSASGTLEPLTMKCDIRMTAQRNYIIFTIKQLFPSIIVVYTGLLSMYLSASDHTGDRIAAVMVSILILMVNFQSDLGIGKITYLVWWDVFNLISMGVLALVLIEALWEHTLITSDQEAKCLIVNQVLRIAFIWAVYPCVLIWLLLYGLQGISTPIGWIVLLGGNLCTAAVSVYYYRKLSRGNQLDRDAVIAKLQSARLSDAEEMEAALTDAFITFDLDNSGRLDIDEVRDLLTNCFKNRIVDSASSPGGAIDTDGDGRISKYEFASLLLTVKKFADGNGTFSLPMLMEALAYATKENISTSGGPAASRGGSISPIATVDVTLKSSKGLNA